MRPGRSRQRVLGAGSLLCLVAPFMFWVGRGTCGWTCYTPLSSSAARFSQPARLSDEHIGLYVATIPAAGLLAIGTVGLCLAILGSHRLGTTAARLTAAAAAILAGWSALLAVARGVSNHAHGYTSEPGFARGGFVGAVGAGCVCLSVFWPSVRSVAARVARATGRSSARPRGLDRPTG